jgi:hypothetical protein
MITSPKEIIARRLLKQAEWCERLGSRLYSTLLRHAAEDVRSAGVCYAVLHDHYDDPPDSALALRFLGAVHRLALQKKAPRLAACYPSAGGHSDCDGLWPAFRSVVREHTAPLRKLVDRPVQTNEVGRLGLLCSQAASRLCLHPQRRPARKVLQKVLEDGLRPGWSAGLAFSRSAPYRGAQPAQAGHRRSVCMEITGHKTASTFRRYDIKSQRDLAEAAAKLDEKRNLLAEKEQSSSRKAENCTENDAMPDIRIPAVVLPN